MQICNGEIADADVNDARSLDAYEHAVGEVRILRNNRQRMSRRMAPNLGVAPIGAEIVHELAIPA